MQNQQEKLDTIKNELLGWWGHNESQGLSSKTLARAAVDDIGSSHISYPYDRSDFRRCVIFKNECPNAFEAAKEVIVRCGHHIWIDYFDQWDRMEGLLKNRSNAKKDEDELYELMLYIRVKRRATEA